MIIKAPKGTKDITPTDIFKWQYLEDKIKDICKRFAYKEIRTPTFEHTELFLRGVGDTTDVVEKQMYTFNDKGDRSITLRPEGTASAVRAFLENSLYANPMPVKFYYIIPCFRYEKPQAGRLREFHQFGIEAFGSDSPSVDAEIISLAMMLLSEIGLKELKLNINSIGCPKCREKYNNKLRDYLKGHLDTLCDTCTGRFNRNPLRILDCKSPVCQKIAEGAPRLIENICDTCKNHFDSVKLYLDELGINYNIDPGIVRGLDYYTKTVFEIISDNIGAQSAVCGGGRYDGLVEELGGSPTPGIGFAMGLERLIMTMDELNIDIPQNDSVTLFVASIGERADRYATKLINSLRSKGLSAERDHLKKSVKAQMKFADKIGAKYSVVIGDNEIDNNSAILKNMKTGETENVVLTQIADFFNKL